MTGVLGVVLAAVLVGPATGVAASTPQFTIVDTIAPTPLATQFSVFGSGGHPIFSTSYRMSAGPTFTLTDVTTLTEVGGFVNNCGTIIGGVPNCPNTQPFFIEIRPVVGGGLQADVVAQFPLSHDDNPLVVSYESATPNVTLDPGTYAALFVAQPGDAGFVLGSADTPFTFFAGSTQIAVIDGSNQYLSETLFAVRITGEVVKGVSEQLSDLLDAVSEVGPGTSLADKIEDAQGAYTAGDTPRTCEILNAFINQVEAQPEKIIASGTASTLIADATQIRAVLGC